MTGSPRWQPQEELRTTIPRIERLKHLAIVHWVMIRNRWLTTPSPKWAWSIERREIGYLGEA
jgi:hypothetical protein